MQLKGAKAPVLATKDKAARDKAAKIATKKAHKEDDAAHDAAMLEEDDNVGGEEMAEE